MSYLYNRDGTPCDDPRKWDFTTADRRIAYTKVTDGAEPTRSFDVSTVFLGMDHGFGLGMPVLFETMVWREGEMDEEHQDRYCYEWQAREGHTMVVLELCNEMTDPIVMEAEHPTTPREEGRK